MYTSEHGIHSVHSLRHTFRPSEPLAERLGAFLKPGQLWPRFSFSSTKEYLLNGEVMLHPEVKVAIAQMQRDFAEKTQEVSLKEVRYRLLGNGALQLAVLPDQAEFATLTQLPEELKKYQVGQERPAPKGGYLLTTTLPHGRLLGEAAIAKQWIELRSGVNNPKKKALNTVQSQSIAETEYPLATPL